MFNSYLCSDVSASKGGNRSVFKADEILILIRLKAEAVIVSGYSALNAVVVFFFNENRSAGESYSSFVIHCVDGDKTFVSKSVATFKAFDIKNNIVSVFKAVFNIKGDFFVKAVFCVNIAFSVEIVNEDWCNISGRSSRFRG